jgi:CAAX prenyl protease-like protein
VLVPFLGVLGAAMLARAASSQFEWFYPLRFFAPAVLLWHYRADYKKLNWRFGVVAVAAGAAAYLLWISFRPASGPYTAPLAIQSAPPYIALGWIVIRICAATITVPVVEELAFRGFLMRWLVRRDFESVNPKSFHILALILSSFLFGLMHGQRWPEGSIAGLLYAAVLLRTGRIGDAVAAHATTNALLAIRVLTRGEWSLW